MKKKHRNEKKHKKHVHRTLYYAPRILALIIGLFFLTMLFDLGYEDGVTPVLTVPESMVPNGTRAG